MKSFFLACTIVLATLVAPAFADTISFTNTGNVSGNIGTGTVISTVDSISLNGGLLESGVLGTLSFNAGSFTGSFKTGGSFTGGDLVFAAEGGAVLFSSTISGTWTKLSNDMYELVGTFAGVLNGVSYTGNTTQFFGFSGGDDNHKHGHDDDRCGTLVDLHGTTTITTATVPEPSTLTFLGTGLIAAAGAVRRKLQVGRRA
jgi:hypothetical protein